MEASFTKKLLRFTNLACCVLVCMLLYSQQGHSSPKALTVTGTVTSNTEKGGLPGVSVILKGTNKGTVTDAKGSFSIVVDNDKSVLVFSMVGYSTKEVQVGNERVINVVLPEAESVLNEVVVVGYGEQKKVNLTGAVETVKFLDAVNQPVTNAGQLMYGRFSGVQLTQGTGLPGADASSVVIRGVGSFGGTTPLVVIDNIQYESLREFNSLGPSDIESISVLKDASAAAIYGARGANGVIVVTTKKGTKGKFSVDYNNSFGFQRVTVVPEYLDAVNYALIKNERDINTNGASAPLRYSPEVIEAIKNGTMPEKYANTNWASIALRNAPMQNHYVSFTGGSEQTTYRISLGALNQDAVVKGKFKLNRYTLGINLSTSPNKWLTVSNVTNAYWSLFKGPSGGPDAITGETGIINQFQRSAPTVPVYYPDDRLGVVDGAYQNVNFSYPINHVLFTGNFGDYNSNNINVSERIGLNAKIAKGLSFETSGSLILNLVNTSNFTPTFTNRDWAGNVVSQSVLNTLTNNFSYNYRLLNENLLRYTTTINDAHSIGFLLGHSVIYDKTKGFSGSLQGFPTDAIQEFDGGGVLNPNVSGSSSEVAWQSFFGRINYNYQEKYLLELNVRRDGSSKFGPANRYGTFPSVSAGWNIGREKFMTGLGFISDLKIRASWGISGNDRIGNYIYQQSYNTGLDYHIGKTTIVPAVAVTTLANPAITWESTEQFDVGMDLSMFKNKLYITADYFKRNSSDILYTNFPIPSTIGVTNLAAKNAAGMQNSGVEFSVNLRQNVRKLKLDLTANATWLADNKVTDLGPDGAETIAGNTIIRVGQPFRAYYGYQVLGVFQNKDEVDGAPVQFGSNKTAAGDLRYADVSGPDGKPDGVVNAFDRVVIGNPFPKWMYGFNANLKYEDFDLSAIFQGVGRIDRLLNANGQLAMDGDRNNALAYWIDRWTPTNPSTALPRVGGVNNSAASTFFVQDMSYLRLKNIELGYSLPGKILKNIFVKKVRIFVSGQNLFTFSKVKNFDPERAPDANTDQTTPLYKVVTGGFNFKF
jgi:TonB-linked SusC/RagA family outer membrane protein